MNIKINQHQIWKQLEVHANELKQKRITQFFENPERITSMTKSIGNFRYDFSKQLVSDKTIKLLFKLVKIVSLEKRIDDMFAKVHINQSENRPAWHVGLRQQPLELEQEAVYQRMMQFVDDLYHGKCRNAKQQNYTDILCLGIGGSDLGPRFVTQALNHHHQQRFNIHFLSNVDELSISKLLAKIPIARTLVFVSSKSFSTPETLTNAQTIREIFDKKLSLQIAQKHFYAMTANSEKAKNSGILDSHIFPFWDWVGGRFSVWSSVGLPIALSLGRHAFEQFLCGAREIDTHFKNEKLENNIPVLMGLIGIWNINFMNYQSLAIIPYADGLEKLPNYLQQLEMESNGKCANFHNGELDYQTAPIIWGGVGCDGQHAYMQHLHQGTCISPVDFILPLHLAHEHREQQRLRIASCLAQARALMLGKEKENTKPLSHLKYCPGNRPSSIIVLDELTPYYLGMLLALYEHKVLVQGSIWQIESFDQWGVELGKIITKDLLVSMLGDEKERKFDDSTNQILNLYKESREI